MDSDTINAMCNSLRRDLCRHGNYEPRAFDLTCKWAIENPHLVSAYKLAIHYTLELSKPSQ